MTERASPWPLFVRAGRRLGGKLTGGDHQGPLAVATPDGAWFATHAGVAMLDPGALCLDESGMPPVIEELSASTRSGGRIRHLLAETHFDGIPARDTRHAIRLPAGSRDVAFRFTAPVFAGIEHLRFRTRLEGYDNEWGAPTAERLAHYAKLPPGSYRFRVMVSSQTGVWREAEPAFLSASALSSGKLRHSVDRRYSGIGCGWSVDRISCPQARPA
jgi:hypothetical protein